MKNFLMLTLILITTTLNALTKEELTANIIKENKLPADIMTRDIPSETAVKKIIEKRIKEEVTPKVNKKYSSERLKKVKELADKKYQPIKEGDKISVKAMRGGRATTITGFYQGKFGSKIRINNKMIFINDIQDDTVKKLDANEINKDKKKYVYSHFTGAKRKYERELEKAIEEEEYKKAGYVFYKRQIKWVPGKDFVKMMLEKEKDKIDKPKVALNDNMSKANGPTGTTSSNIPDPSDFPAIPESQRKYLTYNEKDAYGRRGFLYKWDFQGNYHTVFYELNGDNNIFRISHRFSTTVTENQLYAGISHRILQTLLGLNPGTSLRSNSNVDILNKIINASGSRQSLMGKGYMMVYGKNTKEYYAVFVISKDHPLFNKNKTKVGNANSKPATTIKNFSRIKSSEKHDITSEKQRPIEFTITKSGFIYKKQEIKLPTTIAKLSAVLGENLSKKYLQSKPKRFIWTKIGVEGSGSENRISTITFEFPHQNEYHEYVALLKDKEFVVDNTIFNKNTVKSKLDLEGFTSYKNGWKWSKRHGNIYLLFSADRDNEKLALDSLMISLKDTGAWYR